MGAEQVARAQSSSQQWHRPVYGATAEKDDDDSYDGYPAAPSHHSWAWTSKAGPCTRRARWRGSSASEPIVFWAAARSSPPSLASASCASPAAALPASLPEGRDGRSIQVGYIANSTEAVNAFKGCRQGAGGDVLRRTWAATGSPTSSRRISRRAHDGAPHFARREERRVRRRLAVRRLLLRSRANAGRHPAQGPARVRQGQLRQVHPRGQVPGSPAVSDQRGPFILRVGAPADVRDDGTRRDPRALVAG